MPKADATGLAPKKSADTTLPYRFVCAGGFGFAFCPRTDHPSGKRIQPSQSQKTAPHFFGGVPRAEALGLKREGRPAAFAGRSDSGFCSSRHRDTGHAYISEYPIPLVRPHQPSSDDSAERKPRNQGAKYADTIGGNQCDPLQHTAKRIWDRLKAEHGFGGGYTVVKDYVRGARLQRKEVFVPLVHPPGDAQVDFGEALVVVGGVEQKAHFLCMDLPQSDDCFVMAFPAENTESFLEGHNQAFAYFGGVPWTILYDNTKIAVKEILGDGERKPTQAFSELQSHCLFAVKFGRPGKGNDKGNVEGLVGYARRNFLVPVPRVASWEELNGRLQGECRKRRDRKLWGQEETIAQRFERDREKLLPLPATPYEACERRATRVSSQALVRYETNDYSVPVEYGHRQVLVKAFVCCRH